MLSILLLSTCALADARQAPTPDLAINKKAVKKFADFVVSKKTVDRMHGYFTRSEKPNKELLRGLFFHCDFHKHQLVDLKQCVNELLDLISFSAPLAIHGGFSILSNPVVQDYILALDEADQDELTEELQLQNFVDESDFTKTKSQDLDDYMENIEANLEQDDRELYTQLQDCRVKWERWAEKWQKFFPMIMDYMFARCKLRQMQLDKHVKNYVFSMIWKHIGPTLVLATQTLWNSRKLRGGDNEQEVLVELVKQMHANALENRDQLEEKLTSSIQTSLKSYSKIINEVIDESLKRTP